MASLRSIAKAVLPPVVVETTRRWRPANATSARGPGYYDARTSRRTFSTHYAESRYYPLWSVIADRLRPLTDRAILEVGCGTGQLAELLRDHGMDDYVGFDFSPERILSARERLPQMTFVVADAFVTDLYDGDYDTVICTEFLEHVNDDRGSIRRIRPGTRFIATVPNYGGGAHVRHFVSMQEVRSRYEHLLDSPSITEWKQPKGKVMYLIDGSIPV